MPTATATLAPSVRQALKHAFAQLPRELRLVVLLRHADGLSAAEIAAVLEMDTSRVATLLETATLRLQAAAAAGQAIATA